MATQQVILVAGFNYRAWAIPKENPDGTNFSIFCEDRMNWLLRKLPDAKFSIFDVGQGTVKVSEKDSNKKRSWAPVENFKKVTRALNYTDPKNPRDFTSNADGVMSITDVYSYVQSIGLNDPGTLLELSFFSHSYYKGPILVNSYDKSDTIKRDGNDKDGRYKKDFLPPNMLAAQLKLFRQAFALGGYAWVWGCDAAKIYQAVFDQIAKTPKYRSSGPFGKLKDDDVFSFTFTKAEAEKYYAQDDFFPSRTLAGQLLLNWDAPFKKIKQFFRDGLSDTYAATIAAAAKVLAYGALPGTWAATQRRADRDYLMYVPKKPEEGNGADFSRLIDFYGWYTGAPEDPEGPERGGSRGRGYGTFIP